MMTLKTGRNVFIALIITNSFGAAMAADYSTLSTEEMMNMRSQIIQMSSEERDSFRTEMRTRMSSMTVEERSQFRQKRGHGDGSGQQHQYQQGGNQDAH